MKNNKNNLDEQYYICSSKNLLNYSNYDYEYMSKISEQGGIKASIDLLTNFYSLGVNAKEYVSSLEQKDISNLSADESYLIFLKKIIMDTPQDFEKLNVLENELCQLQNTFINMVSSEEEINRSLKKLNSINGINYLEKAIKEYKNLAKNGDSYSSERLLELSTKHAYLCNFSDKTTKALGHVIEDGYNKNPDSDIQKYLFGKYSLIQGQSISQNLQGKKILESLLENSLELSNWVDNFIKFWRFKINN